MGITNASPPALCLDLTRLISRVGRGPLTGIDRVERAYLDEFLARSVPVFLLIRIGRRQHLLGRAAAVALRDRLAGDTTWRRPDLRALLGRRGRRGGAEAEVRRLAAARVPVSGLATAAADLLPAGTAYYNVGHTNLDGETLHALKAGAGAQIHVMIHDTIPLDFPAFQRPGMPAEFARRLASARTHADRIICVSRAAAADVGRHFGRSHPVPPVTVAPLGVSAPRDQALPPRPDLPPKEPYFLVLGTIEPRKNHALLLDIWQGMAGRPGWPVLVVAGQRGWANAEVLARLDAGIDRVIEVNDLDDAGVWALLRGARALLFPSLAEGFGLPAAEAAMAGVPVLCNDLPVFREILGNYPVYADVADRYSWETKIIELCECRRNANDARARAAVESLTWTNHFATVLDQT